MTVRLEASKRQSSKKGRRRQQEQQMKGVMMFSVQELIDRILAVG